MEDQPELGILAKASLETYGYSVLVAHGIDEAVGRCLSHSGAIDVMLTDFAMPDATGLDVARAVHKLRPNIRVLFMSGYPESDLPGLDGEPPPGRVLQKPYTPETLARAVAEALTREEPWVPPPAGAVPPSVGARPAEIRASYFKAVIAGVKLLPEPHRSQILAVIGGDLRTRIREAALLDWMPADEFVLATDAIAESLGVTEALAFWKASMRASMQRLFLATLTAEAIRNFGKNPATLLNVSPRAWRLLLQGCGGCETRQPAPKSMVVRYTNLPPVLRRKSVVYVWAGGCQACVDEVGFRGTASIRDDDLESGTFEVFVEWD